MGKERSPGGGWPPTPVFLPGESHGQRSLAGYSAWGRKESDTTEVTQHTHTHTHTSFQHKKERMCTMTNDLTSHLSLCSRPATPSCNSPHDCALTRLLKVWLAFLITSTNGSVSTRSPTRETDTISRGSAPTQVRLITIMFNQTLFFPLSSLKATISVISICLTLQWNQFNKTQKSITARCAVFHTFEF